MVVLHIEQDLANWVMPRASLLLRALLNKVLMERSYTQVNLLLSKADSALQLQRWTVMAGNIRPTKPKIVTIWPLREKIYQLLPESRESNSGLKGDKGQSYLSTINFHYKHLSLTPL